MSVLKNFPRSFKDLGNEVKKAFVIDPFKKQKEKLIIDFRALDSYRKFDLGTDKDIGGYSHARLTSNVITGGEFSGYISKRLPLDKKIKNTGYAMIQSNVEPFSFDNNGYYDTSLFRYLAIRYRTWDSIDKRQYLLNMKCRTLIKSDIFQHTLPNTNNEWQTHVIPFNEFALTNKGTILAAQMGMYRQKVSNFGVSINDNKEGPFKIDILYIKMFNSYTSNGDNTL